MDEVMDECMNELMTGLELRYPQPSYRKFTSETAWRYQDAVQTESSSYTGQVGGSGGTEWGENWVNQEKGNEWEIVSNMGGY